MIPQDELPQLTFQVTPALFVSLFTTTVSPVLVLVLSEVTGAFRKVTEIGLGGVGPELVPLLQATASKAMREASAS
jgi:hypothetical protein